MTRHRIRKVTSVSAAGHGGRTRRPRTGGAGPVGSAVFLLLLAGALLARTAPASAQDDSAVVGPGDLAVTGFSGTRPPPDNPPAGESAADETFIDTDAAALRVFGVGAPGGPPEGQLIDAPVKFRASARDIGQVFGVAMDNANPPNIYATAASAHGLNIVVPDEDGDGRPERVTSGQSGARWMAGQFGTAKGGGPGSVWKIDGRTGEITLFADIASNGRPNSGPGLGNIAFDPVHGQLYVSDLDTGRIHRLDMNGNALGSFDHGVDARPALGMKAVPADPDNRADITDPSFDAADPATWGFADERRRVWGLAHHGGRLYYAAVFGPQIWSIGIDDDGGFGDDPRWELDIDPRPENHPVSDIAFDEAGRMIVAQRGGVTASYDYTQHHDSGRNRVLRYRLEQPDDPDTPSRWEEEPEEYAIGFPGEHRNTVGGVAIGYGYERKPDGSYGFGACEGTLWTTGDALRDSDRHRQRLEAGGPMAVHGLQGNDLNLVKPQGAPPWRSYFVDYDGTFEDPQARGHAGDVAIVRDCAKPDLRLHKRSDPDRCDVTGRCTFEVEIENAGAKPYQGPLVIRDIAQGHAALESSSRDWNCSEVAAGTYRCEHPPVSLAPDGTMAFELTFRMPQGWNRHVYRNCAELRTPGSGEDEHAYNNEACDYVPTCQPGDQYCKADLRLEKINLDWNCGWRGNCPYLIRVTNVGASDYTGPLRIRDSAHTPGTTLSHYRPSPPWNCGPIGAATFECTHPSVTLSPGESRSVEVWVNGPVLAAGYTHVRNCSGIEWDGRERDFNPGNEYDCSEIPRYPHGHPRSRPVLKIEKEADPPNCMAGAGPGGGWLCRFYVTITNVGGAPYLDAFEIEDETAGAGPARLADFGDTPPWTCNPGVGAGGVQTCTRPPLPGGLLPGESRELKLEYELPAAVAPPATIQNCAETRQDTDGDGLLETVRGCGHAIVCNVGSADCPKDLAVLKIAQLAPCFPGDTCPFEVEVHNLGNNVHPAGLPITDEPDPAAGPMNQIAPGPPAITCAPAGPNHTCTVNHPILPGDRIDTELEFHVPPDYPATTLENCASVPPGPDNTLAFNDEDCAIGFVPAPDLAPWSPSSCTRGEDCPLTVEINNEGQRPFEGAAGLKGTLSPAVTIKSIESATEGFTCEVTGEGAYECEGADLAIEPGGAAKLEFVAEIPADFEPDEITHTKEMLWPDRDDKDRNPENDRHTSTITIEGPEEPEEAEEPEEEEPREEEEPEEPAGAPDLAVDKTANDSRCGPDQPCGFSVAVENVGDAPYTGPLTVADTMSPENADLSYAGPGQWSCSGAGEGSYACSHPEMTLAPGDATEFTMTFTPQGGAGGSGRNCAELSWTGEAGEARVLSVQQALNDRGIDAGPEDGLYGPKTSQAISEYQRREGLPVTGEIDNVLLADLFGEGDGNPQNDRACAGVTIEAAEEPQPQACTGGRVRNNAGECVCPSSRPRWTGEHCIQRRPQQCSGGRVRNNAGECVCPSSRPRWTGEHCIQERPRQCSGGRVRNNAGECVCPGNTRWTGERCVERRPQQCSGGRVRNDAGQCVCPGNMQWTGVICLPLGDRDEGREDRRPECSGGRVYDRRSESCECPPSRPVWNGEFCAESRTEPGPSERQSCSGGRVRNHDGVCVCPSSRPNWTGQRCVSEQRRREPEQRSIPESLRRRAPELLERFGR